MKTYIFDLDNTLYPYNNGLFDSQMARMSEYIKLKLDIADTEKPMQSVMSYTMSLVQQCLV